MMKGLSIRRKMASSSSCQTELKAASQCILQSKDSCKNCLGSNTGDETVISNYLETSLDGKYRTAMEYMAEEESFCDYANDLTCDFYTDNLVGEKKQNQSILNDFSFVCHYFLIISHLR